MKACLELLLARASSAHSLATDQKSETREKKQPTRLPLSQDFGQLALAAVFSIVSHGTVAVPITHLPSRRLYLSWAYGGRCPPLPVLQYSGEGSDRQYHPAGLLWFLRRSASQNLLNATCRQPEFQGNVREAMRCQNVHEMNFGFDMQGAQAIVNDPFVNRDERSGCRWTFIPTQAYRGYRIPSLYPEVTRQQ